MAGLLTIETKDRFAFTATAGAPAVGDRIVLYGRQRELVNVIGAGPEYLCGFIPDLTVAGATPGAVHATLAGAAALNAIEVDVTFAAGGPPSPGHLFSLGNRMHAIDSVTWLGGGTYRLAIWPWLRSDVAINTIADFAAPKCEMRLASDQEGAEALRAVRLGKWGDVTLRFDEVA